jgi:hypothetical protein
MTDTRTCSYHDCNEPALSASGLSCPEHEKHEEEFFQSVGAMYAEEDQRHVNTDIDWLNDATGAIDATIGNLKMLCDTGNQGCIAGTTEAREVREAAQRLSNRVHEAVVQALQRPQR